MRKVLLLTVGGAVGYVLGARAGRPAYDRLAQRWSDLASTLGIGDIAATVKEAGIDVRDSAVDWASAAVTTSADEVADRIDGRASDSVRTDVGPSRGGGAHPVVSPIGPEPSAG